MQWKYGSEVNWTNLIPLTDITGPEGAEVQLQKSATHIQWKRTDEATWVDLTCFLLILKVIQEHLVQTVLMVRMVRLFLRVTQLQ